MEIVEIFKILESIEKFRFLEILEIFKIVEIIAILEILISAGEDPKQYGRKDRRDTCYSTMFVMVSCRLGKTKPRKIIMLLLPL